MRRLRWLGNVLLVALVLAVGIGLAARLSDGPIGPIAGGALHAGPLVPNSNIDWSFAHDIDTVELQLLEPPRSRTVWIAVVNGELYVPCGLPEFRLWKQWPHEALEDGRAVLRVDGKRYPVTAVRVTDPALLEEVVSAIQRKYLGEGAPSLESTWGFRMDPRTGRSTPGRVGETP